jgi:hypothetical protein
LETKSCLGGGGGLNRQNQNFTLFKTVSHV